MEKALQYYGTIQENIVSYRQLKSAIEAHFVDIKYPLANRNQPVTLSINGNYISRI